jgi:hypothetical protein
MLHRESEFPISTVFRIIKDFLLKVSNYPRRGFDILHSESDLSELDLDTLLIKIPLLLWPIPEGNQCPVSFCRDFPSREEFKEHLRRKHYKL